MLTLPSLPPKTMKLCNKFTIIHALTFFPSGPGRKMSDAEGSGRGSLYLQLPSRISTFFTRFFPSVFYAGSLFQIRRDGIALVVPICEYDGAVSAIE